MKKTRAQQFSIRTISKLGLRGSIFFFVLAFFQINASDFPSITQTSLNLKDPNLSRVIEGKTELSFFKNDADVNVNRKPLQHQITGKVIDKKTGETIPYCNIGTETSTIGTSSNELGEFVITVDTLPVKLIFSHISYEIQVVEVSQSNTVVIKLEPLTHDLNEVTVTASKNDNYATKLVRKAFQKAFQNSNISHYGKAFYRQKSKNGDNYSEFSEIIYDIRYNNREIEDWEILEGRYALKPGGVHNKNFTILSRLITPLQPATDELVFPMHTSFKAFYNLSIIDYITSGKDKIAVVRFKPRKDSQVPTFEAEVYIDTNSRDILKIVGKISHDEIKLVKLSEKKGSWKNYSISYEIAYKKDAVLNATLDYIKIDQGFDYYINDSFKFHTSSSSNLMFFEHYFPKSRKKMGGFYRFNKSDWDRLDDIGYNEKFWAENPIVKRTPVEKEVISAFEKDKAFGSIFLNSRDRVALMQSNISKDPFIKELGTNLRLYNNNNPVEKVYVHTDKDLFSKEETIWFSGYVVLGSHHHFSLGSKVLHIDLINSDNEVVNSQTQEIIEGKASGSIKILDSLLSGNYQLRAYTDWMRNFDDDFFFTKTIKLVDEKNSYNNPSTTKNEIDLQFFPEGGYAVAGLKSLIAFKAVGSDGFDQKLTGQILDSNGKYVATLSTIDRGAGFFSLEPQVGEKYEAVLNNGQKYTLPEIIPQGYTITATNISQKSIAVKVQASPLFKNQPFYVIGIINGKKYYQGRFEFDDRQIVSFEIPKSRMPSGVMTLTLFDGDKIPRCERAVFIHNQEEMVINAKQDQKTFGKRNPIAIDINVTDPNGRPVSGEFSIAVTDAGQVIKGKKSSNILTHLLLESDIKGHIDNPGLLFQDQKRATMHKLDLVMLTHGWRKLSWQEIENAKYPQKEFQFSKGMTLSGIVRGIYKKPLPNATLNAIAKSGEDYEMFSVKTAPDGTFSIPNFNLNGSTELIFSATNNKNKAIDFEMTLEKNKIVAPQPKFRSFVPIDINEAEKYSDFLTARKNTLTFHDTKNITLLDEVVVTEKKIKKISSSRPSNLGQNPDATLYASKNRSAHTVIDLVQMFAGVTVSGNTQSGTATVSIRNQGSPLWVVDGVPVFDDNLASGRAAIKAGVAEAVENGSLDRGAVLAMTLRPVPAPSFIQNMDTFTVERVEILKGGSAALYGSRGANGVILVYTKKGGAEDYDPPPQPADFTIMGHAAQREFYSPKYDVSTQKKITFPIIGQPYIGILLSLQIKMEMPE